MSLAVAGGSRRRSGGAPPAPDVAYDAFSFGPGYTNAGSWPSPHVVGSGSNRALVVFFVTNSTMATATCGGVAMTFLGAYSVGFYFPVYGILNPAVGNNAIDFTCTGGGIASGTSGSFFNVGSFGEFDPGPGPPISLVSSLGDMAVALASSTDTGFTSMTAYPTGGQFEYGPATASSTNIPNASYALNLVKAP